MGGPRGRRATAALRLLVVVLLVAGMPPVRDRIGTVPLLAEAVGAGLPRPFAAGVELREVTVGGRPADLYDAGGGTPAVVVVPGAAPAGRQDERVVRLARALARSHLTVLVPELDLYGHRFTAADLETLVAAVEHARDRAPLLDVTLIGISFGGSLALVTAADTRVAGDVGTVATFGAYADMTHLVQAAATGVSVVGGVEHPWTPPPQARDALDRLALELVPPGRRPSLDAALRGAADPAALPPDARAAHDLVTMTDPGDLAVRLAALAPQARERLARFSPSAVADDVRADVLVLHSRDDPAVPYAELLRMRRAFPGARTFSVESFVHVDLSVDGGLPALARDLWTTWRFGGAVLVAARSTHL